MKKIEFKIIDPAGMHARPASILSKKAGEFSSDINIQFCQKQSNMKSIMGVLAMGIPADSDIIITIDGEDEEDAFMAIKNTIKETKIAG